MTVLTKQEADRTVRLVFATFLSCALLLQPGCSGPAHISPQEFKSQYELGANQSTRVAAYLGQLDGKAYMSIKSMSSMQKAWTERIVYVNLSELDPAFAASLPEKEMPEQPR